MRARTPDMNSITARMERGMEMAREHVAGVVEVSPGEYAVPASTADGTVYTVRPAGGSCDCPDHRYRGISCKHLTVARLAAELQGGAPAATKPELEEDPDTDPADADARRDIEARRIVAADGVSPGPRFSAYNVEAEDGRFVVNPASGECNCPDRRANLVRCAHIRAASLYSGGESDGPPPLDL